MEEDKDSVLKALANSLQTGRNILNVPPGNIRSNINHYPLEIHGPPVMTISSHN